MDFLYAEVVEKINSLKTQNPILLKQIKNIMGEDHFDIEDFIVAVILYKLKPYIEGIADELESMFKEIIDEPQIKESIRLDLVAIRDRDPASDSYFNIILNYKGFQAVTLHRISHFTWMQNNKDLALYLSNISSLVFSIDIHPAASISGGLMIDHGTGVVIGETSVIDKNVTILQNVTLGGTGKEQGDRHPKIKSGVLIGAGAKILGNITIGLNCKIGAGSVVLKSIPNYSTAVGVPAKVIARKDLDIIPAEVIDHL